MHIRHILIAVMVAFVWGINFIVAKVAMEELPPFLLLSLRFVASSLPFIFFIPKPPRISWKLLTAIALTFGVAKFSFVFWSIKLGLPPGLASLLLQTQAFFTIIFAKFIFKSHISTQQSMGMVLSLIGMVFISQDIAAGTSFSGFFCIMIAAILWGCSNMLFQRAGKGDAFALVIWFGLIPPIPLFGLSLWIDGWDVIVYSLTHVTWSGVFAMTFIVIAATWIGTTCWAHLFQKYDAPIVAPYSLLIPIVGITSSWLVYGETYSLSAIIGCALIFLGLIINQWRRQRPQNLSLSSAQR